MLSEEIRDRRLEELVQGLSVAGVPMGIPLVSPHHQVVASKTPLPKREVFRIPIGDGSIGISLMGQGLLAFRDCRDPKPISIKHVTSVGQAVDLALAFVTGQASIHLA